MNTDSIILVLLGIIGTLITALVATWIGQIKNDIGELKDMFTRHVRNSKIHLIPVNPEE